MPRQARDKRSKNSKNEWRFLTGYMRSSATSQAVVSKAVRAKVPVLVTVSDGLEVVAGDVFGEMDHLEGRSGGTAGPMGSAQQVAAGEHTSSNAIIHCHDNDSPCHARSSFQSVSLWVWFGCWQWSLTTLLSLLRRDCAVHAGRGNIGVNPQVSTLTWLVSGEGSFDVELGFQRGGVFKETINVPKPAPASL